MPIADQFLPEFDSEMTTTRKLIEISPDAKAAWKPHPKSMALGDLGLHLANIVQWATLTMTATEFDLNPPGGPKWTPRKFESSAATVVAVRRERQERAHGDRRRQGRGLPGRLDAQGQRQRDPHAPAHRLPAHVRDEPPDPPPRQLSVYLRLCDVKLPQVYGPTADTMK
jgi:hypothetical protein